MTTMPSGHTISMLRLHMYVGIYLLENAPYSCIRVNTDPKQQLTSAKSRKCNNLETTSDDYIVYIQIC